MNNKLCEFFSNLSLDDLDYVGGKNASLGELINNFNMIPNGFAVTTFGYTQFVEKNDLDTKIKILLNDINFKDIHSLQHSGKKIRDLIIKSQFPDELRTDILQKYKELSKMYDSENTDVAVRSSSTAEDLPDASFAGQQDTYLNIRGGVNILDAIKRCFASLFTDRAISYRHDINYDTSKLLISIGIQKMARSDLGMSGVCFSLDTETGFDQVIIINASYGLGEMVVGGNVQPDEYIVDKRFLDGNGIIDKKIGHKHIKMIYDSQATTKIVNTDQEDINKFCLNDEQILELARHVAEIEKHYSKVYGKYTPIDVEWAFDGEINKLFIVQVRPETVASKFVSSNIITENKILNNTKKPFLTGIAIGRRIGIGKVKVIGDISSEKINDFNDGDILVTEITNPDWEPIMKRASAIITNQGGRTCHAAIIARELKVPAIVGTHNGTDILKDNMNVSVSCCEGEIGYIYSGEIAYETIELDISTLPQTKTNIMLNVASPEIAFNYAKYPCKGVGLAREEFIINNFIKVHPSALLNYNQFKTKDPELIQSINKLMTGYSDPKEYYIKKLAYGIARIGSSFYPNDVVVRFSDFKSNEYSNLLGGKYFEPKEENPMIGWRGASRYYSDEFKECFGLECEAIKHVRDVIGLTNVIVMIPFCRTVKECINVLSVMKEYGLERGKNNLQCYLMCEIPSNVLLIKQFSQHVDGYSIGSNDLTQLILGLDRDSALVAHLYDERNDAVKMMLKKVIRKAKKYGLKIGLCGQGPSDFPDFAEFLVECGIDSMSVVPDSFFKTVQTVYEIENKIKS
jgi:pyruvate,water dikinase